MLRAALLIWKSRAIYYEDQTRNQPKLLGAQRNFFFLIWGGAIRGARIFCVLPSYGSDEDVRFWKMVIQEVSEYDSCFVWISYVFEYIPNITICTFLDKKMDGIFVMIIWFGMENYSTRNNYFHHLFCPIF